MVQIEVYVPNLDRDGNELPLDHYLQVLTNLETSILDTAGGYSQYNVNGSWVNKDGQRLHENVVVYRVVVERDGYAHHSILNLAQSLRAMLNQEAILVTTQEVQAKFYA